MAGFQKFDNPVLSGMQMGNQAAMQRGSDLQSSLRTIRTQQMQGQQQALIQDLGHFRRLQAMAAGAAMDPQGRPLDPQIIKNAQGLLESPPDRFAMRSAFGFGPMMTLPEETYRSAVLPLTPKGFSSPIPSTVELIGLSPYSPTYIPTSMKRP